MIKFNYAVGSQFFYSKCFPFSKMDKINVQNQKWLPTLGKKCAILPLHVKETFFTIFFRFVFIDVDKNSYKSTVKEFFSTITSLDILVIILFSLFESVSIDSTIILLYWSE